MDKSEIISLIKSNLAEVLPDLDEGEIDVHETLMNLGANSVDRAELVAITLDSLSLNVPFYKFASARNIAELADLMHQYKNQ